MTGPAARFSLLRTRRQQAARVLHWWVFRAAAVCVLAVAVAGAAWWQWPALTAAYHSRFGPHPTVTITATAGLDHQPERAALSDLIGQADSTLGAAGRRPRSRPRPAAGRRHRGGPHGHGPVRHRPHTGPCRRHAACRRHRGRRTHPAREEDHRPRQTCPARTRTRTRACTARAVRTTPPACTRTAGAPAPIHPRTGPRIPVHRP